MCLPKDTIFVVKAPKVSNPTFSRFKLRPRLNRKAVSGNRINLNNLWSKLEEFNNRELPLVTYELTERGTPVERRVPISRTPPVNNPHGNEPLVNVPSSHTSTSVHFTRTFDTMTRVDSSKELAFQVHEFRSTIDFKDMMDFNDSLDTCKAEEEEEEEEKANFLKETVKEATELAKPSIRFDETRDFKFDTFNKNVVSLIDRNLGFNSTQSYASSLDSSKTSWFDNEINENLLNERIEFQK